MPAPGQRRRIGPDDPLRIAYLSYRGKPHVGGQGVYTRHLTKALVDLGHTVEVFGGQPYPSSTSGSRSPSCPASTSSTTTTPAASPPTGRSRTGPTSSRCASSRPARSASRWRSACAPAAAEARAGRLRPRPRQPEPRLRAARHRAAPADRSSRCTTRSPSTGAWRWSTRRPGASGSASAAGTAS